jgi:hypothetical protein
MRRGGRSWRNHCHPYGSRTCSSASNALSAIGVSASIAGVIGAIKSCASPPVRKTPSDCAVHRRCMDLGLSPPRERLGSLGAGPMLMGAHNGTVAHSIFVIGTGAMLNIQEGYPRAGGRTFSGVRGGHARPGGTLSLCARPRQTPVAVGSAGATTATTLWIIASLAFTIFFVGATRRRQKPTLRARSSRHALLAAGAAGLPVVVSQISGRCPAASG